MQRLCRDTYESADACYSRLWNTHAVNTSKIQGLCAKVCPSLGGARKRKTLRNNKRKNKNKNTKRKTRRN